VGIGSAGSMDILDPVNWRFRSVQVDDKTYDLYFDATIEDGWYVYSQDVADGGPIPTIFTFQENPDVVFELEKPEEISDHMTEGIDKIFQVYVKKFKKEVTFRTRVKVNRENAALRGALEFQTCDDEKCLAPDEREFQFSLSGKGGEGKELGVEDAIGIAGMEYKIESVDIENPVNDCGKEKASDEEKESRGLWYFLLLGMGGGLIALLTPCVFPMIPLTVSFFTKGSKDKKKGIFNAVIYAHSI